MRISLRLTIALLVAAIVPLLVSGIWSIYTLGHASALAADQSEAALFQMGREAIYQTAMSVSREIELYLSTHPKAAASDMAQLQTDTTLSEIAVRPIAQAGYTAVFDQNGITRFHADPGIVGMDMSTLASDFPEFWSVFSASLDGSVSEGYYQWQEADGQTRLKYMSIVPVPGTPLRVAATAYVDEFHQPVVQVREQLARIQGAARLQLAAVILSAALLAAAAAYVVGRQLARPVRSMADVAVQIADGDLTVGATLDESVAGRQTGELGLLSAAFAKMANNLRTLIRQVRIMALDLSSSARQVMMTQRQHAANAEQQAAAVTNAGTAVEQLASSSANIAQSAQQVVTAASQTQTSAQDGVEAMTEAARRLNRISTGNQDAVTKVQDLGDLAREIGVIMDLIEDIAAQTKLIAFNASIEASAAGEAGRRFAVVAGEVRHLANSVGQSTEEIRTKVEQIQTTTNELIIASERESKEIEGGMAVGDTVADVLNQIHESAQQTTIVAQQISLSTQQQRTATEHLLADLQPLGDGARAVAAGSQQTVTVMEDLVAMARELEAAVDRFKLPDSAIGDAEGPVVP